MVHIPILRAGKPYTSLSVQEVAHIQTGEPLVQVSQANRGLVAKDLDAAGVGKPPGCLWKRTCRWAMMCNRPRIM